jgi:hypothetical protein
MKHFLSRLVLITLIFGGGVFTTLWYQAGNSGKKASDKKGPHIQTDQAPSIVGLEIPIRSHNGQGTDAVLKAALADQISEKELRVYGGFEYRTADKLITGEEAIINLVTGTTRQMKGIKIWEK